MTIDQKITPFPVAIPSRQDSESFSPRMDAAMTHFGVFLPELNIMIDQANNFMTSTANDAADSARRALDSAVAAASSASAAEYSKQAAQFLSLVSGYQGDYNPMTPYNSGQSVTYNGMLFISKINGNLGNIPQEGTSWAMLSMGRIMIMRHL